MTHPMSRRLYATRADYYGKDEAAIDEAVAELDRLHAIVELLPKTADGVPVVPGETQWAVFCYDRDDPDEPLRVSACNYVGNASDWTDGIKWEIEDCVDCRCEVIGVYSTREAAEAAKGGER